MKNVYARLFMFLGVIVVFTACGEKAQQSAANQSFVASSAEAVGVNCDKTTGNCNGATETQKAAVEGIAKAQTTVCDKVTGICRQEEAFETPKSPVASERAPANTSTQ